jgi:hypothetical protein
VFLPPPLKFRTVSFRQYGFKAGISDVACPLPGLPSPFAPSAAIGYPRSVSGIDALASTSVRAASAALPRGPRSGPGYVVPVHPRLTDPLRPTPGHIPFSPLCDLYELPSLCASTTAPRLPARGSVLSLTVLYRQVVPKDPGKFIGCCTQFLHP